MVITVPTPPSAETATGGGEYTVDELARTVGMSASNVRAHQARGLLLPPTRRGRVAIYDDRHVRRLEAITSLQRQGFNLASIEAILGPGGDDRGLPAMCRLLDRVSTDEPALVDTLSRHDVVARGEQGCVQIRRPRAVRAALGMDRAGVPAPAAVALLGELLDSTCGVAVVLLRRSCARALALPPASGRPGPDREDELDHATLAEGLVAVIVEAFRVAVENNAENIVAELVTGH